jgi:hypothetical protein
MRRAVGEHQSTPVMRRFCVVSSPILRARKLAVGAPRGVEVREGSHTSPTCPLLRPRPTASRRLRRHPATKARNAHPVASWLSPDELLEHVSWIGCVDPVTPAHCTRPPAGVSDRRAASG